MKEIEPLLMLDEKKLKEMLPGIMLMTKDETVSTNIDAREWLRRDAPDGSLIIAARQTGGKGRMGRSFISAEGGLYMSLILRRTCRAGEMTTLCAVAVCRAVTLLTGIRPDIKWVNDLQVHGKKICGILCEGIWENGSMIGCIAGIGLNISQKHFPPELKGTAASLYPDGNPPVGREEFAAAIYREIIDLLPRIPAHMSEYRKYCITLGRQVCWQTAGREYSGTALDTDGSGALIVQTEDGPVRIEAGEVSLKKR